MNKILIALDTDESALPMAKAGLQWAQQSGAEVILLHVTDEPAYYSDLSYMPVTGFSGMMAHDVTDYAVEIEKASKEFLKSIQEQLGDPAVTTEVVSGNFEEAIADAVKKWNISLLVIGNHNRRGLTKLLVGNRAEKLLGSIKIPMLILPDHRSQ